MKVLTGPGADTKQMLIVFNKMDMVDDVSTSIVLKRHFPHAIFISVHTGRLLMS